ncbi:MAG: hypothetical protein JO352_25800 [Chloroflexi bacterium]|nr:hypothetical protein [Chloroflexota bacterium]
MRELPTALVTLAHEGPKVYADRFDLLHRREADPTRCGSGPRALGLDGARLGARPHGA